MCDTGAQTRPRALGELLMRAMTAGASRKSLRVSSQLRGLSSSVPAVRHDDAQPPAPIERESDEHLPEPLRSKPYVPHYQDVIVHGVWHRRRLRPARVYATLAGWDWFPDPLHPGWPMFIPRGRCHGTYQYAVNCATIVPEGMSMIGAQPVDITTRRKIYMVGEGEDQKIVIIPRITPIANCRWYEYHNPDMANLLGYGLCMAKDLQSRMSAGYFQAERFRTGASQTKVTRIKSPNMRDSACFKRVTQEMNPDPKFWCDDSPPGTHYYWYCLLGKQYASQTVMICWDIYMRFAVPIVIDPEDENAEDLINATLRVMCVQSVATDIAFKIWMIDHDDVPPFPTTSGWYHNCPDDPTVMPRVNPLGEGNNQFALAAPMENGDWRFFNVKALIQAFISRPGYAPGKHVGIVLESVDDLNSEFNNLVCADLDNVKDWYIEITTYLKNATPQQSLGPPKFRPHVRWPGVFGDDKCGRSYADLLWAAEQNYAILHAVDPVMAWWSPETHGGTEPPYPVDAHEKFVIESPPGTGGTYEVPCFTRHRPWRCEGIPSQDPQIPAGARAIVAQRSETSCGPGWIAPYGDCGVHSGPGGTASCTVENSFIRHRGSCRPWRVVWEQDPLKRGWSVTYHVNLETWFAQEADWIGFADPPISPGDQRRHWSAWWTVTITAHLRGDVSDPNFVAWIASLPMGFGGTAEPRYHVCNEVLAMCATSRPLSERKKALGDKIWPPISPINVQSMAVEAGERWKVPIQCDSDAGWSWWYMPFFGSNHIKTPLGEVIPMLPELGLYHQWERKIFTDPELSTDNQRVEHGWCVLRFSTALPKIVVLPPPNFRLTDEVQRVWAHVVDSQEPAEYGWFTLRSGVPGDSQETPMIYVTFSAEQLRDALMTLSVYSGAVLEVEKTGPCLFFVKYRGALARTDVPRMEVAAQGVWGPDDKAAEVWVDTIIQGGQLTWDGEVPE